MSPFVLTEYVCMSDINSHRFGAHTQSPQDGWTCFKQGYCNWTIPLIAIEKSLMAFPRNSKLSIKIQAVGLGGTQAWQCDRAPRIDQNINVQLFGILLSHSWALPSAPDSQHSLPVLLMGFSQQYLHTSEITSGFSFTVLLLQITPVLIEMIVNCGTQQARWRILF